MAYQALTLSTVADNLKQNYGNLLVDNLFKQGIKGRLVPSDSLLGWLREEGRVFTDGADSSDRYAREWGVHITGDTANSFDANSAYPTSTVEGFDRAVLSWSRVGIPIAWDNLAGLSNGVARGGLNQIAIDFELKLKELFSEIDIHLAGDGTGNSSLDIIGFQGAMTTASSYAGISQSNAYWQGAIGAAGSVDLTEALIETNLETLENSKGGIAEGMAFLLNIVQYHKLKNIYKDSIRFNDGDQMGNPFRAMWTNGQKEFPILVNKSVPTDELWMIPSSVCEMRVKTGGNPLGIDSAEDEVLMDEGFPLHLEEIHSQNDQKQLMIKFYGQLVVTNPTKIGAITGLAT